MRQKKAIIKATVCLLALALSAASLRAQVAYVNSATGADPSGGTKTSLSTASFSATAGNLIVVGVRQATDVTIPSGVTDTAGNTYTHVAGADSSFGSGELTVWYAANVTASASNVVTATWATPHTYTSVIARQYSGVANSDAAASATGSGKTLSVGIPYVQSGVTVAFGSASSINSTFSVGTIGGVTAANFVADAPGGSEIAASEDSILTQATAITASMQQSSGSKWVFSVVSFSDGSSGGGGGGTPSSGVVAAGTVTVSNASSASHTFPSALPTGSVCQITPAFDPASLQSLTWWVTNTTSAVTAHLSVAGSGTFNFICTAPGN
jgi:hypothetical protein